MRLVILLVALLSLLASSAAFSQGYTSSGGTSAGLRIGPDAGITLKHHTGSAALEGILHLSDWFQGFTGLYHFFHQPITPDVPGLDWYAAAGGHVWSYRTTFVNRPRWVPAGEGVGIGVDFALGMQYNFPSAPINLALDWKPALNLIGGTGLAFSSVGLSVRYRWK